MRSTCACLFYFLVALQVHAQDIFSTNIGLGLGRHFEHPFPYNKLVNNGRIAISISQYARLTSKYSIGISAMASGRLSAFLGGSPPGDFYDPISNTIIINYNNLNAATYLIKNKIDWIKKSEFVFYSELGAGVSRYQYVHAHRSSFAIAPEIGFTKDAFQFSTSFIWGGETPTFTAPSIANSTILYSIRSNRLYFAISYRLFNF